MKNIINSLITDRSQSDVERFKELKNRVRDKTATPEEVHEFLTLDLKGSYNASDINRVNDAMEYLVKRFADYKITVSLKGTSKVWVGGENPDIPTFEQLKVYLEDISTLRNTIPVLQKTPLVPDDMEDFTHQEANDIEQILIDINEVMDRIIASFRRCGQFTGICGVLPLPVEGWDRGRTWEELDALGWGWDVWDTLTWNQLLYGE